MTAALRPSVHLCIVQPPGYVHSMALLDAALYFRHQFTTLGAQVTIAKNRLRTDAPNLVFGAHLGFDPALTRTFCCLFVNLEQLGAGGSRMPPAYLELLRTSHVIDYDAANRDAYGRAAGDVPLISFGFAPYLSAPPAPAIEERPLDLLFFGSLNERRKRLIERIERAGRTVVTFDAPVYGPERDAFIRQSRAVLNCHHYDSAVFEQVRAFQVLSLGTPLVSERSERTRPGAAFDDAVHWFTNDSLEAFFKGAYAAPDFAERSRTQLETFAGCDPRSQYAGVLEFSGAAFAASRSIRRDPPRPQRLLHLGGAQGYRSGWLNIDTDAALDPDICLDLGSPQSWPRTLASPYWGSVQLEAGASDLIHVDGLAERVGDLDTLMDNCLTLLRSGGLLVLDVPFDPAGTSTHDPRRLRSLDENSWHRYTDGFWHSSWLDYRFKLNEVGWRDAGGRACRKDHASAMTVTLEKTPTTIAERMLSRTHRPDFGNLFEQMPVVAFTTPGSSPAEPGPQSAKTLPMRAVATPAPDNLYSGLNQKLLAAIPPGARRVLELGCANGLLGRRYKERNPGTQWWGVDISPGAAAVAAAHLDRAIALDLDRDDLDQLGRDFDVIVIGDLLERLNLPGRTLDALYERSAAGARIVCCLPNMSHVSVIERLIAGDIAYDSAGLLNASHARFFSQSSAFKTFLDAGWIPTLADQYRVEPAIDPFSAGLLAAAAGMGIPRETALRNLGLYQMIVVCEKWQDRPSAATDGSLPFSVIVAVNRPWQYQLNTARSPGLREVGAELIPIEGADSAAAAFASGAARARHAWRLFAHQDVYFPAGSGHAIARKLAEQERAGGKGVPIGMAGLRPGDGPDNTRPAGMVVDRLSLFRHGPALDAVSMDELAVALHQDSRLAIDPSLGWHLWATDLCLQAQRIAGQPLGRLLTVPVFHNSVSTWTLPEAFHESAQRLLAKYPELMQIPTLCGTLRRKAEHTSQAA